MEENKKESSQNIINDNEKNVKVKINKRAKKSKKSFMTVVLWLILFLGFFTAVFYIYLGDEQSVDFLTEWFSRLIQDKQESDIFNLFLSNVTSASIYLFVIFILGFSPVFSFIVSFVPFFKGLGSGLAITYIYINYGWRGMVYEALIDIPVHILLMLIIILTTKEAINFSNGIYSALKNRVVNDISLKRYFLKFFIIFILIAVISILKAVFDVIFFKYLNIL